MASVWYVGDSMLVEMADSDADSLSEASTDASIPAAVNIDDSPAAAPAPPSELPDQNPPYRADAKERSKTRGDSLLYLRCSSQSLFVRMDN